MTHTTLEFPVADELSVIQNEEAGGGKAHATDGWPNNWTHGHEASKEYPSLLRSLYHPNTIIGITWRLNDGWMDIGSGCASRLEIAARGDLLFSVTSTKKSLSASRRSIAWTEDTAVQASK